MKTKRIVWTIVFLSITLAAIVMEVIAGIFHPAGTIPWTEYLARYVPWPIQLLAYVILATWLPFHFWRHDHMRKAAYIKGVKFGEAQAQRVAHLRQEADAGRLRRAQPPWPTGAHPGEPMCSHGYVFGRTRHVCGELPSDAVRFVPGRSDGR